MKPAFLRTLLATLLLAFAIRLPAQSSLVVAGALHVDLRATNGSAGLATWTNQGTLGNFTRTGTPSLSNDVAGTGVPGVFFNGTSDLYLGPLSVADLEGAGDRSVEIWALNPSISDEETLVSWSHRGGPDGSNLSINYGSSVGAAGYGAVGHWGGSYDLGWPAADSVPMANEWHHIVYTYDGNRTATVYVDGAPRVSKVLPAALNTYAGFSVNIGSQRDNASTLTAGLRLSGYINTVRIHGGALSATDVAANYAYGPAYVPSTSPVAITSSPQDQSVGDTGFANFGVTASGQAPISYQWYRSGALVAGGTNRNLTVGPVAFTDSGAEFFCIASNLVSGTPYTATSAVARLTVIGVGGTLTHRYNFASNVNDQVGTAHGTLVSATLNNGQLVLPGGTAYLDLPDNLVTGYTAVTFETWVLNGGSGNWARVWDFGSAAGNNMFLTWPSGSSTLRASYNQNNTGEQLVDAALPGNNTMHHVVFTQDGASRVARLYVNGTLVGQNTGFTLTPAAIGVTANDWLGRSQYSADPYFIGRIEEFRIYSAALPAAKVLENYVAGPDLPPSDGPVAVVAQPTNTTVVENTTATFSVLLNGRPPFAVQWFKNGDALPGATNATLSYRPVLAEDGAQFFARATNAVIGTNYFTVSSNATVHVLADTNPPVLVRATGAGASAFELLFSEPISAASATNLNNYSAQGPGGAVSLASAALDSEGLSVLVQCAPLILGQTYTVVVNQVQDRAAAPNTIAPNATANFVATAFRVRDIGAASTPSSVTAAQGGFDITAGGTGISGASDQVTLGFEERTGNFDLATRLSTVTLSDVWARAGLMARATLSTNSAFAAVWATPGPAGCFFQARTTVSTNIAPSGSFPVNHPYTWLRLRRAGDVFDGFASIDGQSWAFLGSAVITLPATIDVGLAVTASSSNATTTASFRDYANAGGTIATNAPLPFEPMAPCTRKTGLVFSEIMYNPPDAWATNSLEFVEIHNPDLFYEELDGFQLDGDIHFKFPAGTRLPSGGYLVIARNPAAVQAFYGVTGVLGPFTNNLPNEGGRLRLINDAGGIILEVNYNDKAPWPVAADGAGHSLVLRRPSYGEDDPRAWGVSDLIGGSAGRADSFGSEPLRGVVLNEFLANSDPPLLDFLELFNTTGQPIDLSGAWLSDDPGTNKFRIPNGTTIPARGFVSFDQAQLGFALSSDGDEIFLWNPARTRVFEAYRFGGQAPNISRGRQPDGSPLWGELAAPTPGTANSPVLQRGVVINEIMYHPISESNDDEYVELFNFGTNSVDLSGWQLGDGISFRFPAGAAIPAGGYMVVAENLTNLLAKYPHLTTANTFGNYNGFLRDGGERITLEIPLVTLRTNGAGFVTTNISYITVNEVTYRDGGRWGKWSDGGGSSLELIDPRADNRFAANWADSDESQKAAWTTVDFTAMLDNGMTQGNGTPDRFEILLQDAGECLIDDLEIRSASNLTVNRVLNGDFEGGSTNYTFMGTHRPSFIENGVGTGGTKALHVLAVDRGDPGPNKIWTRIATMPTGQNGTIRAKMRWLKGTRFCILRTRGQWIEAALAMNVPNSLGTPGLANSRAVANAGPAIADVAHAPVLPAAGQPVVVSARLSDPDGIGTVTLRYRLDPSASYSSVDMVDNGTSGDVAAGDGIYSATIPGQMNDAMVAFHLSAGDLAAPPLTSQFPNDAPTRECLIHFGESEFAGPMGTYRFWLTKANIDAWTLRERNSNEPFDATFAYGNHRVMYNIEALYSASPWHTSGQPYTGPLGSTACDYELNFPSDDRFLGWRDFVMAAQESYVSFFNNDLTCQGEYTCYWMGRSLGLTYNHKRVVRGVLNGQRRGMIFFDHQQPNGEYVDEYFADDAEGDLYKIEDWFEFDDIGNGFEVQTCRLLNYTTTGGAKKDARYRYNFRPRAVTGSPNDFAQLFLAVDAVSAPAPEPYLSATYSMIDVDEWMRVFAVQHAVGNWDTYGYRRGKNCFTYKPARGPFKLLLWDMELVLGKSGDGPQQPLFDLGTSGAVDQYEPTIAAMYANPAIVRAFWCAMSELVNGAMVPSGYTPRMNDRYAALLANGMPVEHPSSIWSWIDQRRGFILSQITANASNVFNVTGTNFIETTNMFLTVTGTAPVTVKDVVVNGNAYPITWVNVTTWRMRVPLAAGSNTLVIAGLDRHGQVVSNRTVVASYTGADVSPVGLVVINEIMYHPAIPGTSFLEIYNRSTTTSFDISGWILNGLGFTFPPGSLITNGQYLVVAENRFDYAATYGVSNIIAGEFPAELDNGGETVSLIKPGATPEQDLVVDRVRYEPSAPWPALADGLGTSLQLVDAAQDNARVSNWSESSGWRYFKTNGIPGTSQGRRVMLWLDVAGTVNIDDMFLALGPVAETGSNYVVNGDFELPLVPYWKTNGHNAANSTINTAVKRGGNSSMQLVFTNVGGTSQYFYYDLTNAVTTNFITTSNYTLSFWYLPTTNANRLTVRLGTPINPTFSVRPMLSTPGAANTVIATVSAYPSLWLNEVEPVNFNGVTDNAGEREPWIELFNPGTSAVSLAGCFLSDNYINLAQWAFPAEAEIGPGQFMVVWADGQTNQSAPGNLHANFRINSGSGAVALSRTVGGSPQIIDYLNFTALPADWSYGAVPDGQPFYRYELYYSTPGLTNNATSPPLMVKINEWMAANIAAGGFPDPADGNYDDWFELYNPGPVAVNLEGYYLTDTLTNQFQFRIPAGYTIPAGGFLLVWADNDPGQNSTNRSDLHVNFALRQAGEEIGLFAADGTVIDTVSFLQQTNNVSEGHFPDGSGPRHFMPTYTPRMPNQIPNPPQAPELSGVEIVGGNFSFTIATTPGRTYQVFYKDDLSQPDWLPLGAPQPAGGTSLLITDPVGAHTQRFYTVLETQ